GELRKHSRAQASLVPSGPDEPTAGQMDWQTRALRALYDLALATGGVLDPTRLAQIAVDRARELLAADSAGLYWCDAEAAILRPLAYNDDSSARAPEDWRQGIPTTGTGAVSLAFQRGEPVVIQDYPTWERAR